MSQVGCPTNTRPLRMDYKNKLQSVVVGGYLIVVRLTKNLFIQIPRVKNNKTLDVLIIINTVQVIVVVCCDLNLLKILHQVRDRFRLQT